MSTPLAVVDGLSRQTFTPTQHHATRGAARTERQQVCVRARLHHTASVHDHNPVRACNGGQPVGDDDGGAAGGTASVFLHQGLDGALDSTLAAHSAHGVAEQVQGNMGSTLLLSGPCDYKLQAGHRGTRESVTPWFQYHYQQQQTSGCPGPMSPRPAQAHVGPE